jgi:signal transduction histidine kinase/ligand-binding sensor domain-containing protein
MASPRLFYRYKNAVYISMHLLVLSVFITLPVSAFFDDLKVVHLTQQGMARKSIWSLAQDQDGYIWMGTTNGLHRFDGRDFLIFKTEVRDASSLPNLNVRAFLVDKEGEFWICTQGGGLSRYLKQTKRFENLNPALIKDDTKGPDVFDFWSIAEGSDHKLWLASIAGDGFYSYDREQRRFQRFMLPNSSEKHFSHVICILESSKKQLWIGTLESGIAHLDLSGNVIERWTNLKGSKLQLPSNEVKVLFEDRTGTIWAGFQAGGLAKFQSDKKSFDPVPYFTTAENPGLQNVYAIMEDNKQRLWIATDDGVVVYEPGKGQVVHHIRSRVDDENGLSNNRVRSLLQDKGGVIWIGTEGGGVHRVVQRKKFSSVLPGNGKESLNTGIVRAFFQFDSVRFWIGTQSGGINVWNSATRKMEGAIRNQPGVPGSLSEDRITTFMEDPDRKGIWVGTWGGGLNYYDRQTGKFKVFRYQKADSTSISDDRIQLTYVDSKGRFWVGTENGLNIFDRKKGIFKRLVHDPSKPGNLSGNSIQTFGFLEDSNDVFWVGTWQGFNRYDAATNTAKTFKYKLDDAETLGSDHITAVADAGNGFLWIATFGGGLNYFEKATGKTKVFTEKDGLPHNLVFSIVPDGKGRYWLSTSAGLSRFDPKTLQFVNFFEEDGLQGNDFWWGAAYIATDGRLFFGGTNGFTHFYPDSIFTSAYMPNVVILSVNSVEDELLPDASGIVRFDSRIGHITISFAGLDFQEPSKIQYAHKLHGIDPTWVYTGNQHSVSYASLPGGEYRFEVRATNSDGAWSDKIATLKLVVIPPFWQTGWFRVVSTFVLVVLIAAFFRQRSRNERIQKKLLEDEVKRRTEEIEAQQKKIIDGNIALEMKNKELLELNNEKNYLVSVVAHDLRNPLGSLRGYATYLKEEKNLSSVEYAEVLTAMEQAAQHGLDLISRILDIEAIERKTLSLRQERIEANKLMRSVAQQYEARAAEKHMRLELFPAPRPVYLVADQQYLRQILDNLVSNAFKYAPNGTRVQMLVETEKDEVIFSVRDEGPGIDAEDMKKLFHKFQKLKAKPTGGESSVGLGLSIVKRFTEAMSGRVWCESQPGKGACFKVSFPKA